MYEVKKITQISIWFIVKPETSQLLKYCSRRVVTQQARELDSPDRPIHKYYICSLAQLVRNFTYFSSSFVKDQYYFNGTLHFYISLTNLRYDSRIYMLMEISTVRAFVGRTTRHRLGRYHGLPEFCAREST